MCTGHISCYPYTRTYPPIYCTCDWILLSVTIKTVVSVSQRIYNTEISTAQLQTGVSKHFSAYARKNNLFAP